MTRGNQYHNRAQLLHGTLAMVILQILRWDPQHGSGVMQASGLPRWERVVEPIGPVTHPVPEGGQA
jgi:hypothetical protein